MKTTFFSLLYVIGLAPAYLIAQNNPDSLISKNKIKKCIIKAEEFENDSLVQSAKQIEIYNEDGQPSSFTSYDQDDKQTHIYTYYYHDGGLTKETFDINQNGDTAFRQIFKHTQDGRIIENYQIKYKTGDTLVKQKWIKDHQGKDSVLYTAGKLMIQWFYDSEGNLIRKKVDIGNIHQDENYTAKKQNDCTITYNNNGKKKEIISKQCISGNVKTNYYFKNSTGYLFGIKLIHSEGSKRIETKNEKGLVTEIVYMDAKDHVTARITYTYE
jgi:hypothetical protein